MEEKRWQEGEVASVEMGLLCHSAGACPEQASQHWTPWGGTLRNIQIHSLSMGPRASFSEYGGAVLGVYSLSPQSSCRGQQTEHARRHWNQGRNLTTLMAQTVENQH